MRRRRFLLGAGIVAFGGCSSWDGRDGESTATPARSPDESPDPSTATPTPTQTSTSTARPAVVTARDHLVAAFDELRAMRPVGPDRILARESRFRASDHAVVEERVDAAAAALDGIEAGGAGEAVEALGAAVELGRAGRSLYAAFRRGFRSEWRFERDCYGAWWADARDEAGRSRRAVEAWQRHGTAVTEAVGALEAAGPASVPRLSTEAWRRDGAVLEAVAGPLADRLGGFRGFAEAVRLDEAGLDAMDGGDYARAGDRFTAAAEAVGDAHRRLARAADDGAQGFASYALPVRRRCEPFRTAYSTQVDAAEAAAAGDPDRAEELGGRALDRIIGTQLEHPFPEPEGGVSDPSADATKG